MGKNKKKSKQIGVMDSNDPEAIKVSLQQGISEVLNISALL